MKHAGTTEFAPLNSVILCLFCQTGNSFCSFSPDGLSFIFKLGHNTYDNGQPICSTIPMTMDSQSVLSNDGSMNLLHWMVQLSHLRVTVQSEPRVQHTTHECTHTLYAVNEMIISFQTIWSNSRQNAGSKEEQNCERWGRKVSSELRTLLKRADPFEKSEQRAGKSFSVCEFPPQDDGRRWIWLNLQQT